MRAIAGESTQRGRAQRWGESLQASGTAWLSPAAGRALLGLAMAASAAFVLYQGRGTTLVSDELLFFSGTTDFDLGVLATPYNGQLNIVPRLVFFTSFELFGGDGYIALRIVGMLAVLLTAGLVYTVAKARIGPTAALLPAILLLFFGSAWDLLLVPLNGMLWGGATAAGLGALMLMERMDPRRDLAAMLLLGFSIATGTIGLAFAVGAAVSVALRPHRMRRAWIVLLPVLAYAGWWLWARQQFGTANPLVAENAFQIPSFVANAFGFTWASILGLNVDVGAQRQPDAFPPFAYGWIPALALAFGAVLAIRARLGAMPRLFWVFAATMVAFWTMAALYVGPERLPTTTRYVFSAAALMLLLAVLAVPAARLSRPVLIALVAMLAFSLAGNIHHLLGGGSYFRDYSAHARAQMAMIELARDHIAPDYTPRYTNEFTPSLFFVVADRHFAGVDRFGSPGYSIEELLDQSEVVREGADVVLAQALGVTLGPSPSQPGRDCRTVAADAWRLQGVRLPQGGAELISLSRAPAEISMRRFADEPRVLAGTVASGEPSLLRIPTDGLSRPWIATSETSDPIRVCPV